LQIERRVLVLALIIVGFASPLLGQQKGQWGQFGLNAGVIPDPGFSYANLALNYSADQLNNGNRNRIPGINGTYSFWVDENICLLRAETQVPRRAFHAPRRTQLRKW
jgi:hypothetical protein